MKTMFYFGYGSNINYKQMKQRCPNAEAVGVAKLRGHRLIFRGVADVVPHRNGGAVMGVLWKITPRCLKALDLYEGYPRLYGRRLCSVAVEEDGTLREALIYYMKTGDLAVPHREYWQAIMEGYEDFNMIPRRDMLEPNYGLGNARINYDTEGYYARLNQRQIDYD